MSTASGSGSSASTASTAALSAAADPSSSGPTRMCGSLSWARIVVTLSIVRAVPAALLFDLDETLVLEEPAAVAAFEATARTATGIDAARLAVDARAHARALWYAAPTHPYCRRIGISSWEGLWCRFEGDDESIRALREWSPGYRRDAWARALADQGVDDPALAGELGERFGAERRARHHTFEDAARRARRARRAPDGRRHQRRIVPAAREARRVRARAPLRRGRRLRRARRRQAGRARSSATPSSCSAPTAA